MWRTVRVTLLDPMNMTLGHIDSSSLDLLPEIFGISCYTTCKNSAFVSVQ